MAAAPVRRELLVRRVWTEREMVVNSVVMKMAVVVVSTESVLATVRAVIAVTTVAVVVIVTKHFAFATVRGDLVVPTVMGG